MENKLSVSKIIAIVCISVMIFIMLVVGILIYQTKYKVMQIETYTTSDGRYSVEIMQIGEPDFPFGAAHCKMELFAEGKSVSRYSFLVYDDGASAGTNNFEVYFQSENVQVIVSGSEQPDTIYRLFYDGNVTEEVIGKVTENEPTVPYVFGEEDSGNFDEDMVLDEYEDQKIKEEYEAIFEYLIMEGALSDLEIAAEENDEAPKLQFYYSAKGEERAIVYQYEMLIAGKTAHVEQELRYNKNVEGEDEFVYQENYRFADGVEAKSSAILNFFMVNTQTLEVTDTGRTTW